MMKMGLGKQAVGIQSVRSIADSLRHEMPIIPQVVAEVKKDKIIQLIGIIGKQGSERDLQSIPLSPGQKHATITRDF